MAYQLRVDISAGALTEEELWIWEAPEGATYVGGEVPLRGVFRGRVECVVGESSVGGKWVGRVRGTPWEYACLLG
jgi:hypothetical protein